MGEGSLLVSRPLATLAEVRSSVNPGESRIWPTADQSARPNSSSDTPCASNACKHQIGNLGSRSASLGALRCSKLRIRLTIARIQSLSSPFLSSASRPH